MTDADEPVDPNEPEELSAENAEGSAPSEDAPAPGESAASDANELGSNEAESADADSTESAEAESGPSDVGGEAADVAASGEPGDGVANEVGDDEPNAPEDETPTPNAAVEEAEIRHELGIGGGKIELDHSEIDQLLAGAVIGYEQIFASADAQPDAASGLGDLTGDLASGGDMVAQNLTLLRDVNLKVKVELGRGRMYLKDILRLGQGSVVELERLAGDPLDIYVNEKVIARGEVLVLNENFCIRITEIYSPAEALLGTT